VFYFLSLYMQQVLGFSPLQTGFGYLPITMGFIVVAGVASSLVGRIGAKWLLVIGMLVTAAAFLLLHPADEVLWRMTHPDKDFRTLEPGATFDVGGIELRAIHTPGHSPGSTCLHAPELDAVFSGDTLFSGGPGATGRSYSDFPTILASISQRLGRLPERTTVYTGHGDPTTIGAELRWLSQMASRE